MRPEPELSQVSNIWTCGTLDGMYLPCLTSTAKTSNYSNFATGRYESRQTVMDEDILDRIAVLKTYCGEFTNQVAGHSLGMDSHKKKNPLRNPLPCKEIQKGLDFVPRTGFEPVLPA